MSQATVTSLRPRLAPLPMARWAPWIIVLAALALIGLSAGSYYYHRRQMDSIAARHLRLVVAGPGQLEAGVPCVFNLLTTRVTGEPQSAPVEWSLSTADGKRLVDRKESTDEHGQLAMIVPPDMAIPIQEHAVAKLSLTAGGGDRAVNLTLPLPVRSTQYVTHLEIDRRGYRPGETVYYRSLTLPRFGLAADRTLPLEFEILDAKSVPQADSQWVGLTDHGVGNGSFRLPVSLAAGNYTLIARAAGDEFPEERLNFDVLAPTASPAIAEKTIGSKSKAKSKTKAAVQLDFYPEGGALAAGVPNRVFVFAHDAANRPLEIKADVVNAKSEKIAKLDTSPGGRGQFSLVPGRGESYQVKIQQPAGISEGIPLPPPAADQAVAIMAEQGVVQPAAAMRLEVHASRGNIPLIVTAESNGLLIGQQLLVTSAGDAAGGQFVTIPLDDHACGLVRATVYDATKSPPKVVAERFVYRKPRRLTVREAAQPSGELQLLVENEKGQPVAAALSLMALVRSEAKTAAHAQPSPDLLTAALCGGELSDRAALAGLIFPPTDNDASVAALELALGCQKSATPRAPQADKNAGDSAQGPPAVWDNLDDLRAQYALMLSEYRSQRTHMINALIMLSFFGGLGLALLVTMLAMLGIVGGSQLWLPTVGATFCCVVVTAVSARMQPEEVSGVGFAPYAWPQAAEMDAASIAARKPASVESSAERTLRNLEERLEHGDADAEGLKADRFPVQQYPPSETPAASDNENAKPAAWYPLLIAGPDGRVTVPGMPAKRAKDFRLLIEAHGDGRIESCELSPGP